MSSKKITKLLKILLTVLLFTNVEKIFAGDASIYLNFEDATLESIVNYLAEQKKINFIPHADLKKHKVSLTTKEPLTLDRAWNVMLTLLEMNGFTIIKVDNIYRIVPAKANKKEPLPLYSSQQGVAPKDLPDSDMVVRYIYVLNNISTDVAGRILGDLLGKDKVKTTKELGTCIITDKCFNIKSAMKIIDELDKGGLRESIKMIRLKHTEAETVATMFTNKIFEKQTTKPIRFFPAKQQKEIAFFSSTTKIIPEKRQNALILLGLEQNIDKIIDFIDKYIDIKMEEAKSRIHIKELKYVEAPELASILNKIIVPPRSQKKGRALVGEFKFFEDVIIKAEEAAGGEGDSKINKGSGNRLIISCGRDDWIRLEKLIDKFDKPQPQVALEVMIADIDNTDNRNLGAQIREKTGKSLARGLTVFTSNLRAITPDESTLELEHHENIINAASGEQGTSSITVGKAGDVWATIKSFCATTNTNIVSQPFLVTSNNEPCAYTTKETRRIPGKLEIKDGKSYIRQEEVDATTKITITPRINLMGLIDLKIKIELAEFLAESGDRPPRTTRLLTTRASMATGEVLAMGGLTKNKKTTNTYKTPILGNIPIIGNLFKHKTRENKETNLYLFIRPSIIMPKFEGGPDEYTQLKLDYAKYQIYNAETLKDSKDPIERWYFRPKKESLDTKLKNLKQGIYKPIDNYSEGRKQPISVRIERDPYFRTKEGVKKGAIKRHKITPNNA